MSADRQRLKSAIQRIAKEDPEIRNLLGDGKNKGDQASSAGVGTSEAAESRLCCDGSTSSNANPGTGVRDPDAESQDGLDSGDPAKLSSGDGTLSGVTDCATGEPVCFDGSGHIPPDGWDDPSSPPIDPEYVEGIYYAQSNSTGDGDRFALPRNAADYSVREHIKCDGNCTLIEYYKVNDSWIVEFEDSSGESVFTGFNEYNCGPIHDGTSYCDPDKEDITLDSWPSDGCVNLAVKGGSIVGSKYDPENGGAYSKPMSEINLCDGNGNQIALAPSADGGWKTIDAINGGDGYLYDSQGQQIARISGDEFSDPTI